MLYLLYLIYQQKILFIIINNLLNINVEFFFVKLTIKYSFCKNTNKNRELNCFLEILINFYSILKYNNI